MATYFVSNGVGAGGANNGSSWANAYLTLDACLNRTAPIIAVLDTIYIGDDHNETVALGAAKVLTLPASGQNFVSLICVDHTKASPGAGDLRTTATITYTGAFNVTFSGNWGYMYGVNWIVGSTVNNSAIFIVMFNNINSGAVVENCSFYIPAQGTGGKVIALNGVYTNCTFKWNANTANTATLQVNGPSITQNCVFDLQNGTPATTFFASGVGPWTAEDCDFINQASNTFIAVNASTTGSFKRCRFSNSTLCTLPSSIAPLNIRVDFIQCDVAAGSLLRNERYWNGVLTTNTQVARVGGMVDGTTPISHRCLTGVVTRWNNLPFQAFPIAVWNNVVGSAVNITVEFIADPRSTEFGTIPKNDECWFDVEYLGTAGSTRGTTLKGTKSDFMAVGTVQTASTADWTKGTVPLRANSTALAIGAVIKVASNPGRVFFVYGAGTTASSEPAVYSNVTCVDGSAVFDGTVNLKAGWRFKQTLTVTPQAAGLIYVQPKIAKASLLGGIYIDPMLTVT